MNELLHSFVTTYFQRNIEKENIEEQVKGVKPEAQGSQNA